MRGVDVSRKNVNDDPDDTTVIESDDYITKKIPSIMRKSFGYFYSYEIYSQG